MVAQSSDPSQPIRVQQGSTPVPDPTELTSKAVDALRTEQSELLDAKLTVIYERIRSIEGQIIQERELRKEQKADRSVELAAALSAQKEAVGKTETNFTEQLRGQASTTNTAIASLTQQLNDAKDRLTKIESGKVGGQEATLERRQGNAAVYAAVGAIGGVILVALAVIGFFAARNTGKLEQIPSGAPVVVEVTSAPA